MARRSHLNPSAFSLSGGPAGALLIHGFTGAPTEMRLLGEYLHARGMTVAAPLLPGHGTTPAEMSQQRWQDWTAHVEQALAELRSRCTQVFVGGLSMGALLTLYLAAQHSDLPGVMVYSPALKVPGRAIMLSPLAKYFIKQIDKGPDADKDLTSPTAAAHLWSYEVMPVSSIAQLWALQRQVERLLPRVISPLLVVHSTGDPAIRHDSAQRVFAGVATPATAKSLLTLHNSGHNLLVDSEWEQIAAATWQFIQAHLEPN